jgi:autotransporter strand-loop-strand O-heptosyltransferase
MMIIRWLPIFLKTMSIPIYENLQKAAPSLQINYNFFKGAFVELLGNSPDKFLVQISAGDKMIYSSELQVNQWARTTTQYYLPYHIIVTNLTQGEIIFDYTLDLEGKRVYLELASKALGDTLAWMPYMEEFRKKHNCHLLLTTYHNYLFRGSYPEIEFVEPGNLVEDIHFCTTVGWFYKEGSDEVDWGRNPTDPKAAPMQQTATDILGLPYQEIRPKLDFLQDKRPIRERYVCIANHATLQAKYWNNPTGWQEVVDYLKSRGYTVVLLSKEPDGYHGNFNPKGVMYPKDYELLTIMNLLHHSEFFIGIGSGLSWLSWALKKPTVLISGFSEPYTEMQDCIRVSTPPGKCTGCFNWVRLQNDGDWNWCPRFKGTERMFECSKSITASMVIEKLRPLII